MPERFLKVPHIQQKSSADCLVACAAMMLEFVGFRADYAQISRVLGTSTLGTPHSHILRLSRIYSDLVVVSMDGLRGIYVFNTRSRNDRACLSRE